MQRFSRLLYLSLFLFLPLSIFVAAPVQAETIPPHMNKWVGSLLRQVKPQLDALNGNSPHEKIIQEEYQALKDARVTVWAAGAFDDAALQESLLKIIDGIDAKTAASLLNDASRHGADTALQNYYAAQKKDISADALKKQAGDLEHAIHQSWSGYETTFDVKTKKGHGIALQWDPQQQLVSVLSQTLDAAGNVQQQTQIYGEVQATVGDDNELSFNVTPIADAIQPLDQPEIKAQDAVKEEAILGKWTDREGTVWEFISPRPLDKSKDTPKPVNADDLYTQIQALKKQKSYIWKDRKSGKEISQGKFKRLPDDAYDYVGEQADVETLEKVSALQKEFDLLEKEKKIIPQILTEDPLGFEKMRETASGTLTIKVTTRNGRTYTYDDVVYKGGRIMARRTLRVLDDVDDSIPRDVAAAALASWAPPEWFVVDFVQDPRNGAITMRGAIWGLHVQYGGLDHKIKALHTPFVSQRVNCVREGKAAPRVRLQFVDGDNKPYADELPYNKVVRVQAIFEDAPKEDSRWVRLSWTGLGKSVEWVQVFRARTWGGGDAYYSDPFLLEKDVADEGAALKGYLKL